MTDAMVQAELKAGTRWCYAAPPGLESSRMVIGAIVRFAGSEAIVCCAVRDAGRRLPDGGEDRATIPFLPMTETAFRASVTAHDGADLPPEGFVEALEAWQSDARGLSAFSVPFAGYLDRMIARQMAEIVGPEKV